jgi:membrane-bound lytic murein transglycosylase D
VQSASSSSGAVGLWQFMENSMADFKLLLNEWQDDRLDFYRTTEAALAKLTDNYKVLGNWHLALAAYNAGLGAVQRIVSSSGISDYWTLLERGLLKQETASYVPRLLAVAEILLNPRRYGIQCDWTEDPEWTLVETRRQADLSTVARLAGIDGALFQRANMELLRGVTPPGVTYKLKVREKDRDAILAVLNDPSAELLQYYYYTVQYGDTLWALSRHYGVSIETITSANAGLSSANLRPNAVIRIPALNRDLAPYSSIKEEDIPVYTNTYKVKTGDTLWSIARAHGIDMQALALANGISLDTILHAGDSLSVP